MNNTDFSVAELTYDRATNPSFYSREGQLVLPVELLLPMCD